MVLLIVCTGVGPDRYMTTSRHGMDNFGTVQFQYTRYMLIQPVLLKYNRVDNFGTVFEPFWYIMKNGSKKALNCICMTDRQCV